MSNLNADIAQFEFELLVLNVIHDLSLRIVFDG